MDFRVGGCERVAARQRLVVEQAGVWSHGDKQSALACSPAQVDIIVRHRPGFVESTQLEEEIAVDQQAGAADRRYGPRLSQLARGVAGQAAAKMIPDAVVAAK